MHKLTQQTLTLQINSTASRKDRSVHCIIVHRQNYIGGCGLYHDNDSNAYN